ncbi:hypothetical protein [Sphingomonas sp. Ant20]|uniref:hypothetical protein n=1 Tax=Sphingomonas sp. Ant20 TaxID=104605 RepID=UPI0005373C49|nr:hypothetical protein [Sphingomonas sp. Ant20]KHA63408.1 hypothetical protein NI18_15955 [Sphingomonas sp. Ant20]
MSRFDFVGHRNEVDRMQRRLRRQVAIVQCLAVLMLIASAVAVVWLVSHPEQVGAFFGHIVAGFDAEVNHG